MTLSLGEDLSVLPFRNAYTLSSIPRSEGAALSVPSQEFKNHVSTFFRLFIKQVMGCPGQHNSTVVWK
jgi:hypothetical protein